MLDKLGKQRDAANLALGKAKQPARQESLGEKIDTLDDQIRYYDMRLESLKKEAEEKSVPLYGDDAWLIKQPRFRLKRY